MGGTRKRQPLKILKAGAWAKSQKPVRSTALKRREAASHRADAPRSSTPSKPRPTICELLRSPTITIQDEVEGSCPASANLHLGPDAEQREPQSRVDDVVPTIVPKHLSTHADHNPHILNSTMKPFTLACGCHSKANAYVEKLKKGLVGGDASITGPWVQPRNAIQVAMAINAEREKEGERRIDGMEALNLALRPTVFLWAPESIYEGARVQCPACGSAGSIHGWGESRVLQRVSSKCVYICRRYACNVCLTCPRPGNAKAKSLASVRAKTFLADSEPVMASFPVIVRSAWHLVDMGRVLCDASLLDLVRSTATKLSWTAIADIVNEMKATTWMRDVTLPYLRICDFMKIHPEEFSAQLPEDQKVTSDWVRDLYMDDFRKRRPEILHELAQETGDAILKLDWTKGAATRCKGKFLFNAISGAGKVLASELTATSCPREVEAILWQLRSRGVWPKIAYVDDECCGAWAAIISRVWPACCVCLDSLHALMRLTQTTASTQHPWHGQFCQMLSDALFTYDQQVLQRLRAALARHGQSKTLTKIQTLKYVPRVITNPHKIAMAINEAINGFRHRVHGHMGVRLTAGTDTAWDSLRKHVLRGCLCDPPGIDVNVNDRDEPLQIGDEIFYPVRKLRGTSSLEGYHGHQKRWLGPLGTHSQEAGMALVADGNVRWNRRRGSSQHFEKERAPTIYAHGLNQESRALCKRLSQGGYSNSPWQDCV
jgi:hypothetical protein